MPSFFLTPVIKKRAVKSHAESSSKYNIIVLKVEGTVFINLKGEYYIVVGNEKYNITSENYSCKGVSEVYAQELDNGKVRVRYIRNDMDRLDMNRDMYLPFTAGCSVSGSIVRYKAINQVLFKIRKVYNDVDDPINRQALKFYRVNYKKIRDYLDSQRVPLVIEDIQSDIL